MGARRHARNPGRHRRGARPHPRGDRVLDHRRGRPEGRALRLVLHRGRHRHRGRAPGDDLGRHRRDGAGDDDAGEGPRPRLPLRRDDPDRPDPARRRRAPARQPDALRLALGRHRLRQRPRHPDLHGPDARAARPRAHRLRDDRRRPRADLRPAVSHQGRAVGARHHRAPHRALDEPRPRHPHRRRHGGAAERIAELRPAPGAADPRNPADHPALRADAVDGRPAREPDDGGDRRRAHRHDLEQEPANAPARGWPTSPPACSAAWPAAR